MATQRKWIVTALLGFSAASALPALAQNQAPTGWRRFGDPVQGEQREEVGQSDQVNQPMPPPSALTVPAGTWITVRVNQPISSDHNQQGDVFSATLAQPIVVDGVVVAQRGQTVVGRVAEAVVGRRLPGKVHQAGPRVLR